MTNEEINALTDQQINLMMALNDESHQWTMDPNNKERHIGQEKDYCNDPAVMMPIANENLIAITYGFRGGVLVEASSFDSEFYSGCMEPAKYCRAAAIVYLKMKGVL